MMIRRMVFCRVSLVSIGMWILSINSRGELIFDSQQIQLAANSADKQCTAYFRFKNTGFNTVTITSLRPSCGCTTAEADKIKYAPGDSGEIKTVFTFEGREGLQEKIVQLSTDDVRTSPTRLTLRVDILVPLTCSSRLLLWRMGEEVTEKSVIITPINSRKITAITALASSADVTVRTDAIGEDGKYRLLVRPASTKKLLSVAVNCIATFADGTNQAFVISAFVR